VQFDDDLTMKRKLRNAGGQAEKKKIAGRGGK